jgi:hypothetical protein
LTYGSYGKGTIADSDRNSLLNQQYSSAVSSTFGRISGPLLASNLLRDGVDIAFETSLLYLNVGSAQIGINTDSPTRTLTVNGSGSTTNLIVDTEADLANFVISTNTIRDLLGPITISPRQATNPEVNATLFQAGSLQVSNQLIKNVTTNSNINLSPTGKTVFNTSRLNVNGDLHTTGNITFDGNITFGNANTDNVVFSSDINSDLIPNIDNTYNLGSLGQEWATLYSVNFKTTTINTTGITANGINLVQTLGKTIYVSVNGNDTYHGIHQHSTFRTVKYALSQATSGDTVVIFPGTYTEDFPLTIPQGVAVKGAGIRAVTIEPTVGTKTNNAFLLSGDTTVEFLTVQNFFYNSTYNTGYAFAFAPNFKALARSPYIYNVTVITRGSVTSTADPLGFNQGDAGGGAYLDGSLADPTATIPPTGLFFSVTFITPNQDGIVGTNGVRIEWLNSFSYFAKRGIYLLEGTLGRASQGSVFGAEMRSINSANVYGTYGAVANGAHTLAYLIGHNFGYIGTGADSSNDPQLVIQANEVDQINNGYIYYDSQDHKGDFRIGSIFWVEQSTGNVTFNAQSINFGSTGSIVLHGSGADTILDKNKIQTGNIRVHDNNVDSLVGPIQFSAASGKTYLNTNVFVTGNLGITGDGKVSGNVYLGNDPLDIITIYPQLTQNVLPDSNNFLELGSTLKHWDTLYGTLLDIDGITQITNNTITTLTSGTNLQLTAAGSGIVYVANNDVTIDQSLTVNGPTFTVNGTSSLQALTTVGTTTQTGDFNQIGTSNAYITGLFANNNIEIIGSSYLAGPNIKFYNNEISATALNSDLNFVGNGSGGVRFDYLKFKDNIISNVWASATTDTQQSIIFTPNGTGNVVINSNKSLALPVGNSSNRALGSVGEIRQNSTTGLYEGWSPTGLISFNNIYDSDRNTYITPELTPGYNDNTLRFSINGTVTTTINSTILFSNSIRSDTINIIGSNIGNNITSNDLALLPNGAGVVNVNNLLFKSNEIPNLTNGALILETTGQGYVKFAGTGAVSFPAGLDSERRLNPETGEMRFSTESSKKYVEVYDGVTTMDWVPLGGASATATEEQVKAETDLWAFVLG